MIQSAINKKRVEQSFRKSINSYNQHAVIQEQICNNLISALIAHCGSTFLQVLEIGAGTGLLTSKLIEHISIEKLYINDLVTSMQLPLTNICNTKPSIESSFIMGDAELLSFTSNNNLIISASTIQWFEDLALFIRTKVTKNLIDSGWFVFSTFGSHNMHEIDVIEGNTLHYPALVDLQLMLENDFDIMYCKEEQLVLYFDSPKNVLNHIKQTGVNGLESTRWTKKDLIVFCNSYEQFYVSEKGYSLTYHPLYLIAQKKRY